MGEDYLDRADAKGKNRKQLIVAWAVFTLISITPAFATDKGFDPFPKNKGTIYEYGDDIPDVCFFPVDRARWNGYEVTNKSWGQFTDFQKATFISEGIAVIEQKNNVKVDDSIKGSPRLIVAVNGGVAHIDKTMPNENIAMMKFLYDLLQQENLIIKEAKP